ncbi:unnamed protein product [Schistosoma rodhaini]|nr:unnamed protein product [Schistosoma rodhaini]
MFLLRSEGLTLNEFLSLHPSDNNNISLQSTIYNNNASTEHKFNNKQSISQSRNFSILMNNPSIKKPVNKEGIYSISHETTNPPIITRIKPNFSSKQQLKRSNTVSVTDISKTTNGKLNSNISVDELIKEIRQQKKKLPVQHNRLINTLNDNVIDSNYLIQKLHQQRLFHRAQSEHPTSGNYINNSHSVSLPPHTWNNNTSSTFRSVFSQRGCNFGRSFWQRNFTPDQNELKSSLATAVTSSTSATISSTGTPTHFNRPSSDQCISKVMWSEKFVEEFLKKSLLTTSSNNVVHNQNEPVYLSSSFSGTTLVQWFCRHIIKSGCPWSHGLISVVCQLCNCLLQLGVLRRNLKSKTMNSTSIDNKSFLVHNIHSYRNSSNPTTEIFELNMDYVWSGYNEQGNTIDISSSINVNNDQQQLTQEQQQVDEYKHFQMTIYNHLINLHKEFEYELDRVTREHELQLFKVKNQGVMKVCQLTDRIEALENEVEKYRILAGIEHLNKSLTFEKPSTTHRNNSQDDCYSSIFANKSRLSKVKFSLPNENLLNHLPRRTRAFSETIDLNNVSQQNLNEYTYNKPDYVKSNIVHILSDIEQLLSPESHQKQQRQWDQQQEQQRPQHSRLNSINLQKSHGLSLLKNPKQKYDSFNTQEKENSFNGNRTDLGVLSFDNDTVDLHGDSRTMEDNANKVNNLSKFNNYNIHQHEDSLNTTLSDNENDSQTHQKINLRNFTPRFLSAPPHSKFNLDQTNSLLYSQPVNGILAKYGAKDKQITLKTSMEEDYSSATTMINKGPKDVKRIDKNREIT